MDNNDSISTADEELANRIACSITRCFDDLKVKSGKPTTRSNGVKEWTVLSGMVAMIPTKDESSPQLYPICLATGMKALPDNVRKYSQGSMVHDMHAEILALRLFNWFLLDEIRKISSSDYHSGIIRQTQPGEFELNPDVKLALYISEPPCGDASMNYIADERQPWDDSQPTKKRKSNALEKTELPQDARPREIFRGRANFGQLGVVRTKPGRADSVISYSKSCSDKLCLKQLVGINNVSTSRFFTQPLFLDYLVLSKAKASDADLQRCLRDRFQTSQDDVHYMKCIQFTEDLYKFQKPPQESNTSPSPLSLLYVIPANRTQVLNKGVKNGCFVKGKPANSNGQSFICKRQLIDLSKTLKETAEPSYLKLKQCCKARESKKQRGRDVLGDWPRTGLDDFDL